MKAAQKDLSFLWQQQPKDAKAMEYIIVRTGPKITEQNWMDRGEDNFILLTRGTVVRCILQGSADDYKVVTNPVVEVAQDYATVKGKKKDWALHVFDYSREGE